MEIIEYVKKIEDKLSGYYEYINDIALYNQRKVLNAFRNNNVSYRHFSQTTGYGYDDIGRDTLCKIYAEIFKTEAAIVSPLLCCGTHALTVALFGLLKTGDELLSISGKPYDTLNEVIIGKGNGSLEEYGITYKQVELCGSSFNKSAIKEAICDKTKVVFIGRSRGYEFRDSISLEQIEEVISFIKTINCNIVVMIDNCYGEFTNKSEPTEHGADIAVGSLNKNIGGGLAPCGGYIVGKKILIDRISGRVTSPSLGMEVGSYAAGYLSFYQGLFSAPTVVGSALKGSKLFATAYSNQGYEVLPTISEKPNDIITAVKLNDRDTLIKLCKIIQSISPIDSNVTPEPWSMPGYDCEVIMSAGTFIQGASIELSCDSPVREPYILYVQGGLTYEHIKIAVIECLKEQFGDKIR